MPPNLLRGRKMEQRYDARVQRMSARCKLEFATDARAEQVGERLVERHRPPSWRFRPPFARDYGDRVRLFRQTAGRPTFLNPHPGFPLPQI